MTLRQTHTYKIIAMAWPLFIGQIAMIANGVIDTVMVARFSATDLATLALGVAIYITVFVSLSGVLQAMLPIAGQLFGANKTHEIGAQVKQGAWLVVFLSMAGGLLLYLSPAFLTFAQVAPELADKATLYLTIAMLALPATLGFRLYSCLNTALGRTKMVMMVNIISLLFKIPMNAIFIFGAGPIPAMGGPGCAMATTVIAWMMLFVSWGCVYCIPFYKKIRLFGTGIILPQWSVQKQLLRLGIPMGLTQFIEITSFTLMAVFIARTSVTAVAGHQIIANLGGVLYMLPLSLANATSTLVAQSIGARNEARARRISFSGIRLSGCMAIIAALVLWLCHREITHGYTSDPAIIAAALPLFVYLALYQFFDAFQVVISFILRAYKIVVVPTIIYALSLWGLGLGGGYLVGIDPLGIAPPVLHGAVGFWLSSGISLAFVAAGLFWYLKRIQDQRHLATDTIS